MSKIERDEEEARKPVTQIRSTTERCSQCHSSLFENLETGDQGYTACCNEPIEAIA